MICGGPVELIMTAEDGLQCRYSGAVLKTGKLCNSDRLFVVRWYWHIEGLYGYDSHDRAVWV